MSRVVLDTNILVSALLFRGVTSRLHAIWKRGELKLLISDVSLSELARVLSYPKFKLSPDTVTALLTREVLPFSEQVRPDRQPAACRDSNDDEFLWCARDGCANMLVTGDSDLLVLRPLWSGVPILTVAEALEKLTISPASS